jgi:putative ABC transport system permease protein
MAVAARWTATVEGVAIALESIRANKVRAALTILGIAIGVFVVVAISSVINGVNKGVMADIESAGPNTFFLSRSPIGSFEACDGTDDTCKWRRNPRFTLADAAYLRLLQSLQEVNARINTSAPMKYRNRELSAVGITGSNVGWLNIDGGDIVAGRNFTPGEDASGALVTVINEAGAERLFEGADPLGRQVLVKNVPMTVIGVYKAGLNPFASTDDVKAWIPIATAVRSLNSETRWIGIAVRPRDDVTRANAIDDVTAALRARRGLKPSQDNNFYIITQDKIKESYDQVVGVFFIVMLSLSAVGLLVGGVGVVAIMMISVTERTREIGVRKALGATKGTIRWQFLVEATTLTAIGASLGLVIGWGVAVIVRNAFPVPAEVPGWAVVASLGGSCVTGILFGLLPALKASRLDPVVALRFE